MKRIIFLFFSFLLAAPYVGAQANAGIPADVFYLMPEMTQGTLLFKDRNVNGKFNICAVDQTLRFLDEKGVELALDNDGDLQQVNFPDVTFLHAEGAFYRLYPVSDAAYVAVKRDVTVMTDTKSSSYGMTSSTTAVEEIGMVQSGGHLVSFNDARQYPSQRLPCALEQEELHQVLPLQESRNRSLVRGAQESRCHRHPDGSRPVQGVGRITA